MHKRTQPNLAYRSEVEEENCRIGPIIWRLVATYSLNMVTLNSLLLHNVTTWAHFFPPKNPFCAITFHTFFFPLPSCKNSQKKRKKKGTGSSRSPKYSKIIIFLIHFPL